MSFYVVNQPKWINLFICILRYVLHTLCTFHSDPLNHSFSLAKKVKCRDWLMHEVVRYRTLPQHEQEWVLEQVMKALCPVPEGMLLPPETGLHLEPHPFSNKGRISLPNNRCLHSSMFSFCNINLLPLQGPFVAFSHSHWPAMGCVILEPRMDLPFNMPT
jgi:hypothetical protein